MPELMKNCSMCGDPVPDTEHDFIGNTRVYVCGKRECVRAFDDDLQEYEEERQRAEELARQMEEEAREQEQREQEEEAARAPNGLLMAGPLSNER